MRLPTSVLVTLLIAAFLVLIGLGTWQLQRNEWKQDLVGESHARTDLPPVEVDDATGLDPEELDFRRVHLDGAWALEDAMFLANRARSSVRGEEVVVPVRFASGPAVLVNMGWMPDGARDEVMARLTERRNAGLTGLALDATGRGGRRIPSGSWTGLAPEAMGETLGYEVADWFVLAGEERDAEPSPSEDLPVQGWQRFHNTTPHVEYALTWYGLAAALVAIAVTRFVVAPRRARRVEHSDVEHRPPAPPTGTGAG